MLLKFDSVTIGDGLVWHRPDDQFLTPPRLSAGLWRPVGTIDAESVNRIYGLAAAVHVSRASSSALYDALATWIELCMTEGVLEIFDNDGVTRLRHSDATWVMQPFTPPDPAGGHGGRFLPELIVRFVGATALIADS